VTNNTHGRVCFVLPERQPGCGCELRIRLSPLLDTASARFLWTSGSVYTSNGVQVITEFMHVASYKGGLLLPTPDIKTNPGFYLQPSSAPFPAPGTCTQPKALSCIGQCASAILL
jgi:hypothetical protein